MAIYKNDITIAIIVVYRGENNIKCLREKANKQTNNNNNKKQDGRGRRR